MRKIGVVTVGRSDYGIYLPILRKITSEPGLELNLFVTGMHLSPAFGMTISQIEADGFVITEQFDMLVDSDTPQAIAQSIGLGVIGFSQAFARHRPDILVVLGDRFEMYAAALAALPFKIIVAHVHGGELTYGAIDDSLRHSMTKLSHIHFVSTEEYARRVEQLGEEPWRVTISGAPGLDNLNSVAWFTAPEIEARYDIRLSPSPLLVTFHPVTLEFEQAERQIVELLAALEQSRLPVVFTMPNADTGNMIIRQKIQDYARTHSSTWALDNLGTAGYFSLMKFAAAMVGNSSSGIIEAPSFGLPVVNVGTRQAGRVRAKNVLDVGCSRQEILDGIQHAISPGFRTSLNDLKNPYGDGHASEKIIQRLAGEPLNQSLLMKKFYDLPHND